MKKDYAAILDIGSNAVRLVIYDAVDRAPVKIHNERHLCHLGRGLAETGRLSAEGMRKTLEGITRFATLIRAMKIKRVEAVATAALRDAENGAEFLQEIRRRTGLPVRIIGGEEEARLAAAGVMAGGMGRDGIIGDFGGGSLELIAVKNGRIREKTSLPLGSHRLHAIPGTPARKKKMREELATAAFLEKYRGMDLFTLGGAWRSMARAHINLHGHPLPVLDHYTIPGGEAAAFARRIARQSPAALEKTAGLSKGRVRDIAVAALALEQLVAAMKPRRLVFSAQGVREGLIFDRLPPAQKKKDPLIAGCEKLARRTSRFDSLAPFTALYRWLEPLFRGEDARLVMAACLVSDISSLAHEDYQAELAFRRLLVYPFSGADHAARAFIAAAIHARYKGGLDKEVTAAAQQILGPRDTARALRLGLALRAGWLVSGGALTLLRAAPLKISRAGKVSLSAKAGTALARAPDIGLILEQLSGKARKA